MLGDDAQQGPPTGVAEPASFVLRPQFAALLRTYRSNAGKQARVMVLFILLVAVEILAQPTRAWLVVATVGLLGALFLVVNAAYSARVQVKVSGDRLDWRGIMHRGTFHRADVVRILCYDLDLRNTNRVVLMVDASGRRLLRLHVAFWGGEAVERLVTAARGPTATVEGAGTWPKQSAAVLRDRFPRAYSWPERHPVMTVAGGLGAGFALFFVAALTYTLVAGH